MLSFSIERVGHKIGALVSLHISDCVEGVMISDVDTVSATRLLVYE